MESKYTCREDIINLIRLNLDQYWNENSIINESVINSYFNGEDTFDTIRELVDESCNSDNLLENYGSEVVDFSADDILDIQRQLIHEYGYECIGEKIFDKESLIVWYILSSDVLEQIKGLYDIIKIQRLWRGYDCRWKHPFLMLK